MLIVKTLLRGCHKMGCSVDSRLPITLDILRNIINALPHNVSSLDHRIMLKGLFSLCFHAFLRMGEVTVKQGIAHSRIIQVQDVTFQYNGKKPCRVLLVLRHFQHYIKAIVSELEQQLMLLKKGTLRIIFSN